MCSHQSCLAQWAQRRQGWSPGKEREVPGVGGRPQLGSGKPDGVQAAGMWRQKLWDSAVGLGRQLMHVGELEGPRQLRASCQCSTLCSRLEDSAVASRNLGHWSSLSGVGARAAMLWGGTGNEETAAACCPCPMHTVPSQGSGWPGSRKQGWLLKMTSSWWQLQPEPEFPSTGSRDPLQGYEILQQFGAEQQQICCHIPACVDSCPGPLTCK